MPTDVSGDSEPGPISLADEESVRKLLVNTVFNLWDVVNDLSRLRPSRREHYRVTIFGSARTQPGTFGYEEVKRLAAALADMGCDILPPSAVVSRCYSAGSDALANFHPSASLASSD